MPGLVVDIDSPLYPDIGALFTQRIFDWPTAKRAERGALDASAQQFIQIHA